MSLNKLSVLRAVFGYFGRCATPTRLRWGRILGWLSMRLLRSRRHIVRTNLALCFPDLTQTEREKWVSRHFNLLAQSVVDRGLLWFGSEQSIIDTVSIDGTEHLQQALQEGRRIVLLAPHFIGLDAAATRLTMILAQSATMYTRQSDPAVDQIVREGRARFHTVHLISRKQGVRGLIRHLRNGLPVYYLPDMDFGRSGAIFSSFFGVEAATLPTTAQIASAWDAIVLPIVSQLDLATGHYHVKVLPALQDFPGAQSPEQATARINHLIEDWVRVDPPQYYWVHRRFKTRPEGQPRIY